MMKKILLLMMIAALVFSCKTKQPLTSTRALETVNVGAAPNDGTGDPLRTAFQKINTAIGVMNDVSLDQATGATGTGNLVYSASPTFTGTVTLPTATSIGDVSSTEIGYVNGVTSNIQTQLNARGRVATITANILAGEETDVTLTGVTAEPYSLYIIDADGLNITDAVKDSTAISGGVYHTYIYSVDAKTNAKIRVLW